MILPKKDKQGLCYLSYSQVNSFLTNKKEFIKSYFYNEPIKFTAYLDFGKKVGGALEKGDFSEFTKPEQKILKTVRRLDIFEKEVRLDFPEYNFYLKGFIDTIDNKFTEVLDYKTGTESKIVEYQKDKYIQPLLYAAGIYQETGKLPNKAGVILIDRKGNAYKGEPLTLGNQVWEIPLEVSKERIEYAKKVVIDTAHEISHYYKTFLKLNK